MRSAFVKETEPYASVGVVFVTKTRTCSFPGREEYKKKKIERIVRVRDN